MAYSTINKSTDYFNTKLFTGNGSAGHAITGVGHQPDLTWIKVRGGTGDHGLWDSVRGVSKRIQSNENSAETTTSGVTAFGTDGFTMGTSYNVNNDNYASWNWKAGGGAGSANTDGTINTTSTSVNTTAGFSISKYTGTGSNATVGHGLGAAPKMIIEKQIDSGSNEWGVYHASQGAGKYCKLDTTEAFSSATSVWQGVEPTSTVFSLGTSSLANASSGTHIAYCFAEKKGYSKIGGYTGNDNTDGVFVYTGFKPAFVMIKRTNAADDWYIYDNKREGYNVDNDDLHPNNTNTESTDDKIDLLSNGFKLRINNNDVNGNGDTYVYMAFAAEPLVANVGGSIPATAR